MTDWQAQEMWEADAARRWEELNAPDPYEKQMIESAKMLKKAIYYLAEAIDHTCYAAQELEGTPMESVVDSYVDDMESVLGYLRGLKESYERGERE